MKSKLLLTIIASFCLATIATAQCKYVTPQKDEWTTETYNFAKMAIGTQLAMRELIMYEANGKYFLGLRITFNTDFPDIPFKENDKVSIKLENNEVIEIVAPKDLPPITIRVLDVPLRMWYVHQEVPKTVFEKVSVSPIKAVRFKLNDADQDLPGIKERQTQKIMETAKCMLETFGK